MRNIPDRLRDGPVAVHLSCIYRWIPSSLLPFVKLLNDAGNIVPGFLSAMQQLSSTLKATFSHIGLPPGK